MKRGFLYAEGAKGAEEAEKMGWGRLRGRVERKEEKPGSPHPGPLPSEWEREEERRKRGERGEGRGGRGEKGEGRGERGEGRRMVLECCGSALGWLWFI